MYKNKINIDWLDIVVDVKHDPTKLSKGLIIYLDESHDQTKLSKGLIIYLDDNNDFGKVQKSYSPKYIESKNKHILKVGEFKHEVRQFQKPYDNQQAEQISLMV